jgi:nitroreductase
MNIIKNAPVLLVETTVNARSGYERDGSFTTSKGTHWQSYDAGISAQTLCLTAHEYGLATVIMGIFEESKVAEAISLEDGKSVSALIALGYPDDEPVAPKRKEVSDILTILD